MRATTPAGRTYSVTRRWLPWRRRVKDVGEPGGWDLVPDLAGFADDALGLILLVVAGLVAAVLVIPGLVLALGAALEIALLVALLPLFVLLRAVFGVSWEVEVRDTGAPGLVWRVVHTEKVHGWGASGARIRELAESIRLGGFTTEAGQT